MHLWNIWLLWGRIFIKIHQFWSQWFISFAWKNTVLRTMCLYFSKMSNIQHRAVIKFFTRKGLNAIEISKELDNVYKNSAPSYCIVAKWVAEFKDPERAFEGAPRMGRPSTITADENIEARRIDRNAWSTNLYSSPSWKIAHYPWDHEQSHGHEEGLHTVGTEIVYMLIVWIVVKSEVNPDNGFWLHRNRRWVTTILPTKVRWTNTNSDSAKKDQLETMMMMMIFLDKRCTEYLPRGTVRIMHQSLNDCVLSLWRKGAAKLPVECCFFMTMPPFTCLRCLASLNWIILPILCILHRLITICCQTWRNFFVWRILAPMTKQQWPLLTDLNSEFFCKGIQSLYDRWQRVKVKYMYIELFIHSLTVHELHELSEQRNNNKFR